jgi:hypothetical protein
MHIAFLSTGGKLNVCPLCVEAQADPNSPKYKDADRRGKPPIPCPEHGDPRILYPENRDAIEIYKRLKDYHITKEYETGGKRRKKTHLDLSLALSLCRALKIEDIQDTLTKLDVIHSEIYHHE